MTPIWLIENDVFEDHEISPLKEEILRQGFDIVVRDHPSIQHRDSISDWFPLNECVVFYGSLELSALIHRKASWIPGSFCTIDEFRCSNYYPHFGSLLLNGDYVMLPVGELERRKDFLFDLYGERDGIFIRPNRGDKIWTGKIVYSDDWDAGLDLIKFHDVKQDEMALICRPKRILGEWRFVVAGENIVSGSMSAPEIDGNVPDCIIDFAKQVLRDVGFRPDPIWTLDICETADGLFVLEIGSFSCAALYECDVKPIVKAASFIAESMWLDVHEEN